MKRLYFLSPDIASTENIVNELKLLGIQDTHIHVVGKYHHEFQQAHIHEANLLQTTDFIKALERGAAVGGVTGIIAGLAAISLPITGLVFGGGAILSLALIGAGFGAWASSMIGISIPDEGVKKFENAIIEGKILVLIDIPPLREEEIRGAVCRHHPDAVIEGCELPIQ